MKEINLKRPTNILEASKLLESNTTFELPTNLLVPLGLRAMAFDLPDFKSSKSLHEGYVIIERI